MTDLTSVMRRSDREKEGRARFVDDSQTIKTE
jgi:hypothetical protein